MTGQVMPIRHCVIIGGGLIRRPCAAVFARVGREVTVVEPEPARHEGAGRHVAGFLTITGDADLASRVELTSDLASAVAQADWVQECVPEALQLKADVFAELIKLAKPDAVLASSASELVMSEIIVDERDQAQTLVAHPTNAPHLLRFVEVVPGPGTAAVVTSSAINFLHEIGQLPVLLEREVPGHILNRLQVALERGAFWLARRGFATASQIDLAVAEGLGPRWAFLGPFAVEESNTAGFRDGKRKFSAYFDRMSLSINQLFVGLDLEDIDRIVADMPETTGHREGTELHDHRDLPLPRLRAVKESQ